MNVNVFSLPRRGIVRLVCGVALLLAGLGAMPLGAHAQDDEVAGASFWAGQSAVVADGPLNLRSGAGTGYGVIEQLATGDSVEIVSDPTSADGYQWNLVSVDATGSTGYVASVFLVPASGLSFSIGDTVYVNTDSVNVRSGPGTGYSAIGTLSYGTNGSVIDGPVFADGYTWYELDYVGGSSDGWVAGDFLSLITTGGGYPIGDAVEITTDRLNIRSGPGLGYDVVGSFALGDQAVIMDGPVTADSYPWYQVQYADANGYFYNGWVVADYIAPVSGDFAIGDMVSVTTNGLNVRSGPGLDYGVIDGLDYGATGTVIDGPVLSDSNAWYQLAYGGSQSGWVAGAYLARS